MEAATTDRPAGGLAITDDELRAVQDAVYREVGIVLADTKRVMVCSRLGRRIRHHGVGSVGEYLRLVATDQTGAERQEFVNALTTNKTDFFREAHHFDFLRDTVIPQARAAGRRLRVWSAGCSTGEEPYTLAMTLRDHCPAADGWDVKVLASDVDTAVLAAAEAGVYPADRVADVPRELLARHFLRGTGANAGRVAVRPELRDLLTFRQVNFRAPAWPVRGAFDAIFCRNVMIYFDRDFQRTILDRFAAHLKPDGFLFVGHSENLHGVTDAFTPLGQTVYAPRGAVPRPRPAAAPRPAAPAPPARPAPPAGPAAPEHTIILGDVKATRGPAVLKTLLGSCVSACVYDPETGAGGMNHFSLPGVSDAGTCARYGAHAMELLVTAVMKQGGDRSRLRAKVFGGAKVLDLSSERLNVGSKNAAFVIQYLSDEGIPVTGQCLGGTSGLLVRFDPHTGRARVKPLAGRELTGVVKSEETFGRDLLDRVAAPPDDRITMF